MAIDLKDLRRIAEAATPGPWFNVNYGGFHEVQTTEEYGPQYDLTDEDRCPKAKANGVFIAAANPQTILALLDELENERNRADGLQAELDELKRIEKD